MEFSPRMDMPEDTNARTIESYERCIEEYISGTPHEVTGGYKDWIDDSIEGLPARARILEIGSGTGRDAIYIQSAGHSVECTDAARGFVDHLNQQGLDARELNVLTDDLDENSYDLVLAVAVLVHFNREQTMDVLVKISESLKEGGKFSFSLKQGDGEGWSEDKLGAPRYFCYWRNEDVEAALRAAGYSRYDVSDSGADDNAKWLRAIAYK